jgi:hypothetical protein
VSETIDSSPSKRNSRTAWLVLAVSLVLMLGGSLLAAYVQSGAANATVHSVTFYGSYSASYSAYLWVPNGVDQTHPAPGILAVHGYNNSKEYMANTALELARRGYVVLDMDQDGHGDSDSSTVGTFTVPSPNGIGALDGLKYLRSLPMVDDNNIGMIGMSMGGLAIDSAAFACQDCYQSLFMMDSACFICFPAEKNLAISVGQETELPSFTGGAATGNDIPSVPAYEKEFGTTTPIVPGQLYGSIADGTARIMYYHFGDHAISTDDPTSIGNAITWFGMTLVGGSSLPSSNQIWPFKDLGTGVAFVGFALFLFALGALLLRTSFFSSLNGEAPEYKGNVGRRWWVFAVFTAFIGPVLFWWAFHFGDTANWFNIEAVTTGFAFWLALVGVITIAVLLGGYYLWGRKAGATGVNYGLTWPGVGFDWPKIGKSAALALVVIGAGYVAVFVATSWLKVDFRFWVLTVKVTNLRHFIIMPVYVIPLALYFVPLAIALNGTLRPKNGQATVTREVLTNIGMLLIGVVALLAFYYVPLTFMNGPAGDQGLGTINFIALLALIPVLAALVTYFFRKTGHIYVGAFMCTFFISWYLVAANTVW